MCTWNSNKPYFRKCLNSIKREIPVHHFILVDRFSTDGTVRAVKELFPNVKIIESNARLAVSRKLGIELVDTEFFIFMDSDIELLNGWFKRIINHIDSNIGAIEGSRIYPQQHITAWLECSRSLQVRFKEAFRRKVILITSKNVERGLAFDPSNTLFRTLVVRDYNPPTILSYGPGEGFFLLRHIVRKGYTWKALSNAITIHHTIQSLKDWIRKSKWLGAGERLIKFEKRSLWSQIREASKETFCALLCSLQTAQPMILPYIALRQLARIQGWVNWNKYLEV